MIGLPSWMHLVLLIVCLTAPPSHGIRACGKQLNDALSLLCPNGFSTKVKKSIDPLDFYVDSEGSEDQASALDSWPYLTGIESHSLTTTRRKRLGIVHECCMKACSTSELMSYCRSR